MGQLARMVGRHQDLLLHATPEKADVAVIYNPLAYLVGGEQHLSEAGAVREALQGVYRALWKQNIPCDFVHLSEVESGELGHYKVAFLTYPLMLTRKVAERLRGFVEDGGVLYAEARCGWNDERGYAQEIIPGFGLNEVFGVREGRLKMEKEVILKLISDSMEGLSGRLVTPIVGTGIREELLPAEGTEVLGRFEDGSPALTVRRFGRGKAYMAGSFLSIANGQSDRESNDRVFQAIARDAGAEPVLGIDLPVTDPPCEIRLLRAGDASLIYLFNHSTEKVSVPLPFGHLTDLERDQPLSGGNVVLQPGEIRALLGR
jgi:beta-galactosidase